MERITLEQQKSTAFDFEKEISREQIENLPDYEEAGAFYRGVKVEEAIKAIFGKLKIDAHPENDPVGSRDNVGINLHEAIYFSPSSQTKEGKKFLCAIGFDVLPDAKIEDSRLKRETFARVTGPIIAKEIILRFAGKKQGEPQKTVKYFSPKEFYQWYKENVA